MSSAVLFCVAILCFPLAIYGDLTHEGRTEPGELSSHQYPRPYRRSAADSWAFERPDGVWAVVFEDLDIEPTVRCQDDYLLIRDPISRRDLIRACGDTLPEPVFSSGPKLLISFHSDKLNEGRGFRLNVLHSMTIEDLKARVIQPTTTPKHVPSKAVQLNRNDLLVLCLSMALLVAVLVLVCLAGWVVYQHCFRRGHSHCCTCSRTPSGKDMVVNMEPVVVARQTRSYTKKPRPKEPPADVTGNGSPNVYLPMPDSETTDQSGSSSLLRRKGTDATSNGQLPLYYTPQPTHIEEVKFIGVM